jgi:hypothetical protein
MLRLLRCVDVLDCATELSLWTFAAELELMDYVTMRLCLHELLAAEQVQYGGGALKHHLYLTEKGREALQLFGDRLPAEIAGKIGGAAGKFRDRISLRQQVRAAYESAAHNDYKLSLSVAEGDLTMLLIRMETKSRRLAGRAIRQFGAQAAKVMVYLYQLAQSAQGGKQNGVAEGEIIRQSAGEFTACHTLTGRRAAFNVTLTLPTQEAAQAYLAQFSDAATAADTAEKLLKLICAIRF